MMNDILSFQRLPALLALADGSVFWGSSIGAEGITVGELVFNTAMTGYQEIITDPSYAQQIVTFTYPHIGNVGVNSDDMESDRAWVAGLVIRDLSPIVSNWRAQESLPDFLVRQGVVAIADVDTRRLTRILRSRGAQNSCIMTGTVDADKAIALAREFPSMEGMDLAKKVSCQKPYHFSRTGHKKIIVYDFGVKTNILRQLAERGAEVIVVPAMTPVEDVLKQHPDGVVLSNGPGDPAACDYAIRATQKLLEANIPIFGICLGCQILGLACGAKTKKMRFSHHGANHPVQNLKTKFVAITSQNHGFVLDEESLPAALEITHVSLFDGTIQGIRHTEKPAFAFQGHPEASPGPHDIGVLFDYFLESLTHHAQTN